MATKLIYTYDVPVTHVLLSMRCRASTSTGKERDSESGLDNFTARYFGSSLGRFMSPDSANTAGDLDESGNPQSWNAYSYTHNNPLNAVDPDGQDCVYINDNSASLVRDAICRIKFKNYPNCMTASIGVATYGETSTTTNDVVRDADDAMLTAKKGGRNQVRLANRLSEVVSPPTGVAAKPTKQTIKAQLATFLKEGLEIQKGLHYRISIQSDKSRNGNNA